LELSSFFEDFLSKESIFSDKSVLETSYMPETMPHRAEQIHQIASILAPVLKMEKPSNLFIYGKPGSGKTLSIKHISGEIKKVSLEKNINVKIVYLNCKLKKISDTEYRLIARLASEFGREIPPTGLPTEEAYKVFYSAIEAEKAIIILIFDEIDQLSKKAGDDILYNLTRINEELKNTKVSLVGISNDLVFVDSLDPRVKSSLSEEEVIFPAYNAVQLKDILKMRADKAFKKDTLAEGVIEKCAAYSAREHGDSRRALELLRVSGEVAERSGSSVVQLRHVDEAEEKLEKDRVVETVKTQPKQHQIILYATILAHANEKSKLIFTGEIYEIYKKLCYKTKFRPLTQRRFSDIISEFDMLGVITAKIISKGRYGRTREISVPQTLLLPKIKNMLEEEIGLRSSLSS